MSTTRTAAAEPPHPFDAACVAPLLRQNTQPPHETVNLEPGVRFFVRAIEKWGGTTRFSCEGHPDGFYINFLGSTELARKISDLGFFRVEVDPEPSSWCVRMPERAMVGTHSARGGGQTVTFGPWTEKRKVAFLRRAAEWWAQAL